MIRISLVDKEEIRKRFHNREQWRRNVSGLHVLANLQYLPAGDNIAKRNQFNCSCEACALADTG